jgi:WD40 repeat protein
MAKDLVIYGNDLIIGTDNGKMQVYDYVKKSFVMETGLPTIKDFMGETIPARISSVDRSGGRYLMVSDSGEGGYSNMWIYENNQTVQIISPKDKEPIIKARFIDKDHILLGFLSDEMALYDLKTKKEIYRVQLSESKFSDFALNEKKDKAVVACESGVLTVIDTKTGKTIRELSGLNVDNVYRVSFRNGLISAAGQDRRGAIYHLDSGKGYYIQGTFLIYATALSPSAKKVAFAMDEHNDISIYSTSTKEKKAILSGQKSTLNVIVFKDENILFSGSNDNTVMMWKID